MQAMDNLIPVVLESVKNLTNLAFDVIAFLILDQLSSTSKDKEKADGMNEGMVLMR